MVDILHRIGVTSSPEEVYAALTTIDGLGRLVDGGHEGRQPIPAASSSSASRRA